MTDTTYKAIKLTGPIDEYGGRKVEGYGPWTAAEVLAIYDGQPEHGIIVTLDIEYATKADAEAALAAYGLPKSVRARAIECTGPIGDSYMNGSRHWAVIDIHVDGTATSMRRTSKTMGGVNETGRKRLAKFLEVTSRAL